MKLLVTGVRGFLGTVLERQAVTAGWIVSGLDFGLYDEPETYPRSDFQDLQVDDLRGYDAVVHLAGISSDAACELRSAAATRINGAAAVKLARKAKVAGVRRFVFASSCSTYGFAPNQISTERSLCAPLSTYARSKLQAETGILAQATSSFLPTALRIATLYGLSSSLRTDLVVNAMVASAQISGEISLHGTGEQARPLINVEDAALVILDLLKAGDDEVRGQIFNVTDFSTGYCIAHIAELVRAAVPGSRIVRHPSAADHRYYLADGSRLHALCRRSLRRLDVGIADIANALSHADWQRRASAPNSNRARGLQNLLERGELTDDLCWRG